jgi:ferrous iron transport protein A
MPLIFAKINQTYIIKFIRGNDKVIKHINDLGFVVGAEIKPVQKLGGNFIIAVKDSRIAIDESMAKRIIV